MGRGKGDEGGGRGKGGEGAGGKGRGASRAMVIKAEAVLEYFTLVYAAYSCGRRPQAPALVRIQSFRRNRPYLVTHS